MSDKNFITHFTIFTGHVTNNTKLILHLHVGWPLRQSCEYFANQSLTTATKILPNMFVWAHLTLGFLQGMTWFLLSSAPILA